jgi:hypothetical protein
MQFFSISTEPVLTISTKNHTACNTAVVVEDDNRRWLGPPSFPVTEPGRDASLVLEVLVYENMEQDKFANEINSSCKTNIWAVRQ